MNYKGVDYTLYQGACKVLTSNEDYFLQFKSAGFYRQILEHIVYEDGVLILNEIRKLYNVSDKEIQDFCNLNDCIGLTQKSKFSDDLNCSPTSLRYVLHAHIILEYQKKLNLNNIRIVEVGGGYGGLMLAILFYSTKFGINIQEYTIIDLPEANLIQKKYLSFFTIPIPYNILSSENYGKDVQGDNLFFISNFCFSEISSEYAEQYIQHLLPKCSHGFLDWNMRFIFDFGKKIRIQPCVPDFGLDHNHHVFF